MSSDIQTKALEILRDRIEDHDRRFRQVRKSGAAPEAVHDFRVAARRLIVAVDATGGWVGRASAQKLHRRLKERMSALSRLRDLQVIVEAIRTLPVEESLDPGILDALDRRIQRRQQKAKATFNARTRKRDRDALARYGRKVERAFAAVAGEEVASALRANANDRARKVVRMVEKSDNDIAALHRIRIAVKRFRYQLELISAAGLLRGGARILSDAKYWQDRFGEIQDLEVIYDELKWLDAPRKMLDSVLDRRNRVAASIAADGEQLSGYVYKASAGYDEHTHRPGRARARKKEVKDVRGS